MREQLKLPIGIESFSKIRTSGFYYVDKTRLIEQLLKNPSEVNLFTRPRRFGKSLNMSMLQNFFEIGCNKMLFDGLDIFQNTALCDAYMAQFPVISITLKGVDGQTYADAVAAMKDIIGMEAARFPFLAESTNLTDTEKDLYRGYVQVENGIFSMPNEALPAALRNISLLLAKHFQKEVIILIDEYDVPLDKAFQHGYYNEMISLIRTMLGNALKTNNSLKFAVLTGCLRITKESVFTGLNNFKIYSITSTAFDEYFGFTDSDVKKLLHYYGLESNYETVRTWYDGYHFGNMDVYCPWDVINYCADHLSDPALPPQNYWLNTSGNAIVRRFIDMAGAQTRNEMEDLIAGKSISKDIHQELTYNELDQSIENLWSVLFTTGYLTTKSGIRDNPYQLMIPNQEIRRLFIDQIRIWFKETSRANKETISTFCSAFPERNAAVIETLFDDYLWNMISVRDNATKEKKENFYHGILLGLLRFKENWIIKSNAESGIGYSDILIKIPENRIGIVIELKYADDRNLDAACDKALAQIEDQQYAASLEEDGMKTIIKYGIACYKKECKVKLG